MNIKGSNDDCYFYYYSSCTKGDECPFRHSKAALGTETVCSLWREGRCFRENCKFRHMENRIKRSTIQCYWEDQPSGCLKPHCVFLHRKPRTTIHSNTGNEGLILPVSNTPSQVNHTVKVSDAKDMVKSIIFSPVAESYSNHMSSPTLSPISHPVEPIVVSFDGEESDSESACSTPMKSSNDLKCDSSSVKKNLNDDFTDKKENNFGIKTLEQIRMEKIHKESEHFYKPDDIVDAVIPDKSVGVVRNATFLNDNYPLSAYDSPITDPGLLKMKTGISYKMERCLESDFTSVSDMSTDEPVAPINDTTHQSADNESVINRWMLKRRQLQMHSDRTSPPCKKIALKRNSKEEDPLNFKIKTLEEIRKEREGKLVNNDELSKDNNIEENISIDNNSVSTAASSKNAFESSNLNGKPFRRLKIKRHMKESPPNSALHLEANHTKENQEKENRAQMILHEVQNISEEQNKLDVKGKRKEIEAPCTNKNPKQLKTESSSSNCTNNLPHTSDEILSNSIIEKQTKTANRPVIKRSHLSSSASPASLKIPTPVAETEKIEQISTKSSDKPDVDIKEQLISTSSKDKKSTRPSVDDLDNFLLNEGELPLDYEPDSINESDDILLEIEQLLES